MQLLREDLDRLQQLLGILTVPLKFDGQRCQMQGLGLFNLLFGWGFFLRRLGTAQRHHEQKNSCHQQENSFHICSFFRGGSGLSEAALL